MIAKYSLMKLLTKILGSKMRKVAGSCKDAADYALRDSLSTIKKAQVQMHRLTGMGTTPTVLVSQIELCDVLLLEISGIHSNLAKDIRLSR